MIMLGSPNAIRPQYVPRADSADHRFPPCLLGHQRGLFFTTTPHAPHLRNDDDDDDNACESVHPDDVQRAHHEEPFRGVVVHFLKKSSFLSSARPSALLPGAP